MHQKHIKHTIQRTFSDKYNTPFPQPQINHVHLNKGDMIGLQLIGVVTNRYFSIFATVLSLQAPSHTNFSKSGTTMDFRQ